MTSKEKEKDKRLYKTYGITIGEWQEILDKQEGVCYICRQMPKSGVLCIDHIHVKGFKTMKSEDKKQYVRGLLCFLCNTAIRVYERTSDGQRNRQMLKGTVEYFDEYKIKGD